MVKIKYPKEITEISERFFRQAYETLYGNLFDIIKNDKEIGLTMNAFNHSINYNGFCPSLTTRPDGFKTAILIIEKVINVDE